jgi:sarcosine oxidase
MELAVVGLGAVGAACLYQAASRSARAIGFDRFDPPHALGSSHGETRITRQAIGEGEAYVPLALRSHAIWDELEEQTGETLIDRCGFLLIVREDADSRHHGKPGFLASTLAAARRFGIAHDCMDATDIARRFPQFGGLVGDEHGYFEPGGGQLFPERCIDVQLRLARGLGAVTRTATHVLAVRPDGAGVRITTTGGDVLADRAVVAAGAWMPRLAPAVAGRLVVHRQTMHWFELRDRAAWRGEAPTYIWNHGTGPEGQFYGFPPRTGDADIKCAREQYDVTCDPDTMARTVETAESDSLYERHVRGRLVGVAPARTRAAACCYTMAPEGEFIVEQHPDSAAILLVSACSGHGFKHAAALGEALAMKLLTGSTAQDLSPFGLRA